MEIWVSSTNPPPALVHFKEVDVENDDSTASRRTKYSGRTVELTVSFSAGGIIRIITALEISHRWVPVGYV